MEEENADSDAVPPATSDRRRRGSGTMTPEVGAGGSGGLEYLPTMGIVATDQEDWDCVIPHHGEQSDCVLHSSNDIASSKNDEDENEEEDDSNEQQEQQHDEELWITQGGGGVEEIIEETASDDVSSSTCSSSHDVSYTPPDSLPVVWVDVERLTGYRPTCTEERVNLQNTIRSALWGEEEGDANEPQHQGGAHPNEEADGDEKKDGPDRKEDALVLARDFDRRVTELFDTGMARHADTETDVRSSLEMQPSVFVAVPYPDYLCCQLGKTINKKKVLSTERAWKKLLQPHDIDVVDRLLRYLAQCSRSLLWKYDMRKEIINLAKHEQEFATRKFLREQMEYWKHGRRKEQLEKLYEVRETLQGRVHGAQAHQEALEERREQMVRCEFQKRRLETQVQPSGGGGGGFGLEAFDFESTVFAFPEKDDFLGLYKEDDNNDDVNPPLLHDECDDEDNGPDNYEESDLSDDSTASSFSSENEPNHVTQPALPLMEPRRPHRCRKERRRAAVQKRKQRLEANAKEAEHQAKLEAAKQEENRVRDLCTTPELKIAMAVTKSLEERLQQVDALLESLQEEEWDDEEEEEEHDDDVANNGESKGSISAKQPQAPSDSVESHQLSLLDQILAMILGATPPAEGVDVREHVLTLEDAHRSFLSAWKTHFGRLPPPLTDTASAWEDASHESKVVTTTAAATATAGARTSSSEAMRQSLGIVDSEKDRWDDDDDDMDGSSSLQEAKPQKIAPVGLRPGGRVPF